MTAKRELVGAALASANAAADRPTKAKAGKPCTCGCGGTTGGGTFLPGHDARYKSALIREAQAGNEDALAELDRRGWRKFLDKAHQAQTRAALPDRERRAVLAVTEELAVAARYQRYAAMKVAAKVLKAHRVEGDDRKVTADTYEDILRDYKEFLT